MNKFLVHITGLNGYTEVIIFEVLEEAQVYVWEARHIFKDTGFKVSLYELM